MKVSIFPWIAKKLKQCLAIVQDGDTADRNISSGKYVCWKGDMYTANQAITSGETLSSGSGGNLSACSEGGLNALNGKKKPFYNSGQISTTDLSTAVATAIKNAYNNGYLQSTRETVTIAFTLSNSIPYDIESISYNGNTVYFIVYSYDNVYSGYCGVNDTSCGRFEQLALNSKIATQMVENPVTFNTTSTTSTSRVSSLSKSANVISLHIEVTMVSNSGWGVVGVVNSAYKPKHETYITVSNLAASTIKTAYIDTEGNIRIYAPDAVTYYLDITYII